MNRIVNVVALVCAVSVSLSVVSCRPDPGEQLTRIRMPGTETEATTPIAAPVYANVQSDEYRPGAGPENVLLVINKASDESREIGTYYRVKRKIPADNVLQIDVSRTENIGETEFNIGIKGPVEEAIQKIRTPINYIVLTSGIPLRVGDNNGVSVDGQLAVMNLNLKPMSSPEPPEIQRNRNPYFGARDSFASSKYKMYLVTRLTGYTVADARKLVDNSLAATRKDGPFFFDMAENRRSTSYGQLQSLMQKAHSELSSRGFESLIDDTDEFVVPANPVMGYITWGSNDAAFNREKYKKVRFLPGAICETFVSTSARTFQRTDEGQSLIADLIESGVTGVKGYVSEPYTFALARPDILFDRYTRGFNLAESFYAASPVINWKDLVIGDPLCRPYAAASVESR